MDNSTLKLVSDKDLPVEERQLGPFTEMYLRNAMNHLFRVTKGIMVDKRGSMVLMSEGQAFSLLHTVIRALDEAQQQKDALQLKGGN